MEGQRYVSSDHCSSEPRRKFLEKLGTQPDCLESGCSSTSNPQRPNDQFFTSLEAKFNDLFFVSARTNKRHHHHLSSKPLSRGQTLILPARRMIPCISRCLGDGTRRTSASSGQPAAAKFETTHNCYTQSGVNDECFCLCVSTGFYTFSGWTVAFAQEERVTEPDNCDVFGKKISKVLPNGVRMTGRVVGPPSSCGVEVTVLSTNKQHSLSGGYAGVHERRSHIQKLGG